MGAMKNLTIGIDQIVEAKTQDFDGLSVSMGILAAHSVIREVFSEEPMDSLLHEALMYACEQARQKWREGRLSVNN